MVRIKYKKLSEFQIQSNEIASEKGAIYFARIDFKNGLWQIFNAKRRNCIKTGKSANRNVLRRMVRREFQRLGVKLEKEFKESGYAKNRSML